MIMKDIIFEDVMPCRLVGVGKKGDSVWVIVYITRFTLQ
jgi:hypothetical protein